MTTLILNVDRDNDFGEKAHIKTPVLGYSQCYNAAVKLISIDPEDSDSNALFGALKHYEMLQSKGEDVDIALVTGDDDVGPKSDEIIASQLDIIMQPGKYKDVILISDGAEDDYIIPLILSRAPIRYIKHIIVRHNQNIESMNYYIVRAMQDKKLVRKIAMPIGLILLTYGIAALGFAIAFTITGSTNSNSSFYAFILVIVVIGAYFTEKGFQLKDNMILLSDKLREYSEQARIMFISTIISLGIFFVGIASTYTILSSTGNLLNNILIFLQQFSIWIYASIGSRGIFKLVDIYVAGSVKTDSIYYAIAFSVSAEILLYGIIGYIRYSLKFSNFNYSIFSVGLILTGVAIALITAGIKRRKSIVETGIATEEESA